MFVPLNHLAATRRSIESLETNYQVKPAWRNRDSILGSLVSIALGVTGSSALATFYSLQGLFNTVQIFALILTTIIPHKGHNVSHDWRQLFLGTIPNILALNFASTLIQSLIFLLIFMALAGLLLYIFHVSASPCKRYNRFEGFQQPGNGSGWRIVIVSFLLTIIYLPLSTMAVHVITWSDDLWAVPNPYVNSTTGLPIVSPLGSPDQFRDPLDFCYTTTMKKNEINFAPAVVIIAIAILIFLTISYPLSLRALINESVPIVDKYTELGKLRSESDMDREYQRLLERDCNPLAFLYGGLRRGWGTYEPLYLFMKFAALLIVAVVDPDNCFFRSFSRTRVAVVRQILLLTATVLFFVLQWILSPFLDPVNNASEWMSRLNYVLTSLVSLLVALDVPGRSVIDGPVLYFIYVATYSFTFYFTIINLSATQRLVKRLTSRIDFSIDIFSPRLDISSSSPHTKRRIWQEAITTLFLTSPECKIPDKQPMHYIQANNSEFPPYLLDFQGTPGERHVENIKILREVGSGDYDKAVALLHGPDSARLLRLIGLIQHNFVGPDCYWRNQKLPLPGCTRFFGNAWWIPFPPTLVIRYDDGPLIVLRDFPDFEQYVKQNADPEVHRRREIRIALRALDGQSIYWPYRHINNENSRFPLCCRGTRYKAQASTLYEHATLNIKRKGYLMWDGLQLGSGFDIELVFDKRVTVDGDVIGINDDYNLTPALAQFLALNHALIHSRLRSLESLLANYRQFCHNECKKKADVLTYRFLSQVYDHPKDPERLAKSSIEQERDLRVRQLLVGSEAAFQTSYDRLLAVSSTELATWWYIFWDDFWRRNSDTIKNLRLHAPDFNPHYPTSIAYTPLPRPALEYFLTQRGLLNKKPKWGNFIDNGFLNKVYVRMYDIVFHGSSQAHIFHLGYDTHGLDMEDIDIETQGRPSSLGTGGGTDHDDSSIRPRPAFRWEGILDDPLAKKSHRKFLAKMGVWLGWTPIWRIGNRSVGVALDIRLDGDRYVLMDGMHEGSQRR
ncbi:hypothetical protein BC834DRAFT_814779 [Gloeopeniophorella convolvens]|nr:hypothetical protein BC834DRAFT_814779 [Gloeopeniophorella convolvens]